MGKALERTPISPLIPTIGILPQLVTNSPSLILTEMEYVVDGEMVVMIYFSMEKQLYGGGNFGSSETSYFGDEGKEFSAFYQGQFYTLSCDWISEQNQFPISTVCTYQNGDAGYQCPCVCFDFI